MLTSIDARLARCRLVVGEMRDNFEDIEGHIEQLDSKQEELKDEMQDSLNPSIFLYFKLP